MEPLGVMRSGEQEFMKRIGVLIKLNQVSLTLFILLEVSKKTVIYV